MNCFALTQGREVFSLPGKVDSGNSFGTNELIKQGAKLVTCIDDILAELALPVVNARKLKVNLEPVVCESEESELYDLISDQSIQLDDLVEKTKMDIPRISDILLKLQLKKLIKQLPGRQFIRA